MRNKVPRLTISSEPVAEYGESFNSKFRDDPDVIGTGGDSLLVEAEVLTEPWRRDYNQYRRPSNLGYRTPAELAAQWSEQNGHWLGALPHSPGIYRFPDYYYSATGHLNPAAGFDRSFGSSVDCI